jgi:UDP-N-acetylglucosamine/UDP-N-acetyl-alpha-D-glucosaminouronate 4-epimerase
VRVLLTGATGFVGSQVLEQLLERGDEVRVLALPDTVESLRHRDRVEVIAGNLSDSAALAEATRGAEIVYHLAAIHLSALRAIADPADLRIVNVEGTGRLLRACANGAVRRVVFTSSVAVYNTAPWRFMWPIRETHPLRTTGEDNLRSYALSKIEAEDVIRRAHQEHGIETIVLRPPAVYGPGAPWLERLLRAIAANPWSALTRAGRFAGNQWIHRRDLGRAIVTGGTAPELRYEICNVAGPEVFSARDLLLILSRVLRQGPWQHLLPAELEQTARYGYRYDMARTQTRLGFAPQIKLEEGIAEVLAAMSPTPEIATILRDLQRSPLAEVERF